MIKKNKMTLALSAGLLASTLLLAGCAGNTSNSMAGMDMGSMDGMSGMGPDSNQNPSPTPSSTSTYGVLGDGDVMFAQMMIPHESQAMDMSTMALANSKNAKLKAFASKLKAEQATDVATMTAWLTSIGATSYGTQETEHQMAGMEVAGTVTDAQLTAMSAAMGSEFDSMYVKYMLAQLEGCLTMAKSVAATSNVNVASFAKSVVSLRTTEIADLKAIGK